MVDKDECLTDAETGPASLFGQRQVALAFNVRSTL
jgi:hypothetical protein